MKTTRTERVRQVLKSYGMPMTKLADMMGVSQGTLSNQFSRDSITQDTIDFILVNFPDINARWLLLGEGEMFDGSQEQSDRMMEKIQETIQKNSVRNKPISVEERQQKMIDELIDLAMHSQRRMIRVNEIVDKLAGVCESFATNIATKEIECKALRTEVANVHALLTEIVKNMCHHEGKQINFHTTSIENQTL